MARLTNPVWWQRLRHSRGFGIHSPFAFRLITEVLRPQRSYAYYSEATGEQDRNSRLEARLRAFFEPGTTVLVADLGAPGADIPALAARISRGDVVLLLLNHRGRLGTLLKLMPHGMSFVNRGSRAVLAVCPHLRRQDFNVRF